MKILGFLISFFVTVFVATSSIAAQENDFVVDALNHYFTSTSDGSVGPQPIVSADINEGHVTLQTTDEVSTTNTSTVEAKGSIWFIDYQTGRQLGIYEFSCKIDVRNGFVPIARVSACSALRYKDNAPSDYP